MEKLIMIVGFIFYGIVWGGGFQAHFEIQIININ